MHFSKSFLRTTLQGLSYVSLYLYSCVNADNKYFQNSYYLSIFYGVIPSLSLKLKFAVFNLSLYLP